MEITKTKNLKSFFLKKQKMNNVSFGLRKNNKLPKLYDMRKFLFVLEKLSGNI